MYLDSVPGAWPPGPVPGLSRGPMAAKAEGCRGKKGERREVTHGCKALLRALSALQQGSQGPNLGLPEP